MLEGEGVGAAGAVALVTEVGDDAHVAEAVPARSEERVLYRLHAYRAQQVLVQLLRAPRRASSRFFCRMPREGRVIRLRIWLPIPLRLHHRRNYRSSAR